MYSIYRILSRLHVLYTVYCTVSYIHNYCMLSLELCLFIRDPPPLLQECVSKGTSVLRGITFLK
jgi:hypothetical protein